MQRYHTSSFSSVVNNGVVSGIQAGDTSRAELPAAVPNSTVNSRRPVQSTPCALRCDKEHLNSRLGPPDFHPQTTNCPEETLTREYVQLGYRDTVEGLEEAREILLSQVEAFPTPIIVKCKEAIRKYHRTINESRAQKRKAGQVYEVPLSGTLLSKSGVYPELRSCGEDARKKWIEGLSQNHKRLSSLADHVPHGYRRKSMFEVLIRNNVPLLRATWFIKVIYLNQVRPSSSNSSSGSLEKVQFSRSEQWTKDVIEYLQYLLDEFMSKNIAHSTLHMRDRLSQIGYPSSLQQRAGSLSTASDGDEPSFYTKWWYLVRIIHWHHTEGLLVPSLIIDWALHQLQEKEFLGVVQLLLPIIYGVIETVVLSQTYVHTLLGIAIRLIQDPSPDGADLIDNSRHAYTSSAVVEMIRYLILAVPDTFVAVDCFPLPISVVRYVVYDGRFLFKMVEDGRKLKDGHVNFTGDKNYGVQTESLSIVSVVSSIQKCAETLSKVARPNHSGHDVARALQVLDQTLKNGDVELAYGLLFENLWNGLCAERWVAEVNLSLQMSLKHISSVPSSVISSIFFICEWATSEYRDSCIGPTRGLKFTGRRDPSQIFIASRLLQLKMSHLSNVYPSKRRSKSTSDIFESPGPLHDIIVCWIDQHEVHNGEGFNRVQFLVRQLIQSGVFNPLAYVRQLIVSGNMDEDGPMFGSQRQKRHQKLLKELPASYIRDTLEEAQIVDSAVVVEVMTVYCNERRLVLTGLLEEIVSKPNMHGSAKKKKHQNCFESGGSPSSVEQPHLKTTCSLSVTKIETDIKLEELKGSISALLQLPILPPLDASINELQRNNINSSSANGIDISEEMYGCEECRRVKKRKLSEERDSFLHSDSVDDPDLWWARKGLKDMEPFRTEPPRKPLKQVSRGRQKSVRKTQSLAQLSDARIEGSQGASASHVCESRMGCPLHCTGSDEVTSFTGGTGKPHSRDILLIGRLLKKMQFFKKRIVALWLISLVKQIIEEAEKYTTKVGQYSRPLPPVDDRSSLTWRLGEDELSSILYIMDVCNEFVSAIRFLVWLFPKLKRNPGSTINGRNAVMLPRTGEKHPCEVTEGFLISCISRYENVIVSSDLITEILAAMLHHTAAVLAFNGRISGSPALVFSARLLRKYGNIASVLEWEKNFISTCDKRLSSELEDTKSLEWGFILGVPSGVEDPDDYLRQKVAGVRVSRIGSNMKQIVQRHVDEVFQCFHGKDRKPFGAGTNKIPSTDKWDDGCHIAHKIVMGLMECMRQTGGAAQEGDPILVSSAIAAIVNSVGPAIARILDLTANSNRANAPQPAGSLQFARYILHIHISCLCILKDALGGRHSRVFEVALATEASSSLFTPGKPSRSQFQIYSESHDFSSHSFIEASNYSSKAGLGTAARNSAAVSALVMGAILHGVASLGRMVTLFRLKDGLDLIQFVRNLKANSNGSAHSMGTLKMDNSIEVSLNWFRVLVGNCRTVSDGFVVELLGEASILALSRMQRMLALHLVFPPAYSIFAFLVWRHILDANFGVREDFRQLYQLLSVAMDDVIKHLPFREICLRDTCGLYDLITADSLDCDFVSVLESTGSDINLKAAAVIPLRSRLFLNALIDCKIPQSTVKLDDRNWASGRGELKKQFGENMKKIMGKLVHILDTLQPARFHWQWVELRLLLNEQAVYEKIDNDISVVEAIRTLLSTPEKGTASETESNFVQLILTRLLVRPDAAPLFSEVVHLLGKSVEDSMLSQAKWLLRGTEVLYGKKSIRQKIVQIATELRELCLKSQYSKPWGWCHSNVNRAINKGKKRKSEGSALEEGEVVDEATNFVQSGKGSSFLDVEGFIVSQQRVTESALIDLILPCVDRGSNDLRYNFVNEMFNQLSNIEQQINAVTRGVRKQVVTPGPVGSPTSKSGSRKGGKSNSSVISRQPMGAADTVPPSPSALRASLALRLQFLIRLLPIICAGREPSIQKLRCALPSVILHLLCSRVVYEDADHFVKSAFLFSKRDPESILAMAAAADELCGENIFDYLLFVFHVLLSSNEPSWLKPKPKSKAAECSKGHSPFDHEVAQNLQNELDRMELPQSIRWRIQTVMPILFTSFRHSISCHPPSVSPSALACLQPSNLATTSNSSSSTSSHRSQLPGRVKTKPHLDHDADIDQWCLLEDGTGSIPPSVNSASTNDQHSYLKASSWLKGAVRVRRTELTYIGPVDEDS